jgi:hypothetical protein
LPTNRLEGNTPSTRHCTKRAARVDSSAPRATGSNARSPAQSLPEPTDGATHLLEIAVVKRRERELLALLLRLRVFVVTFSERGCAQMLAQGFTRPIELMSECVRERVATSSQCVAKVRAELGKATPRGAKPYALRDPLREEAELKRVAQRIEIVTNPGELEETIELEAPLEEGAEARDRFTAAHRLLHRVEKLTQGKYFLLRKALGSKPLPEVPRGAGASEERRESRIETGTIRRALEKNGRGRLAQGKRILPAERVH